MNSTSFKLRDLADFRESRFEDVPTAPNCVGRQDQPYDKLNSGDLSCWDMTGWAAPDRWRAKGFHVKDRQGSAGGQGGVVAERHGCISGANVQEVQEEATHIVTELETLDNEMSRQAHVADQAIQELEGKASMLLAEFAEARRESRQRVQAMGRRREALEQELAALERRAADRQVQTSVSAATTSIGSTVPGTSESQAQMEDRIARAEACLQKDTAGGEVQEQIRSAEASLTKLRVQCSDMESRLASAGASTGGAHGSGAVWVSRFEALMAAQAVLTDRAVVGMSDHSTSDVDRTLTVCSNSLRLAEEDARASPPEHLIAAMRCMHGFAWSERRRRSLLAEKWRDMQQSNKSLAGAMPAATASAPSLSEVAQATPFKTQANLRRGPSAAGLLPAAAAAPPPIIAPIIPPTRNEPPVAHTFSPRSPLDWER